MSAPSEPPESSTPSRAAIARILRETADLLELKGENPFRSRAYSNGARAVEGMVEDPHELYEAGTLAEVKGVGPGLVSGIAEILQTGKLGLHDELRTAFPAGVLDLLRVPGLGPKRLRTLIEVLQLDSVAALERACTEGRVAALAGFGEKSQQKLVAGLAAMQRFAERHLLPVAFEAAQGILRRLRAHPAVERAEIAGSLRRHLETIGDLDFVAAVGDDHRQSVADHFLADPLAVQTIERDETKVSLLATGDFRVDLRMVRADEFAAAWLHFTGSKEHNVGLRSRAKARG